MDAETSPGLTPCDICGATEAHELPEAVIHGSGGVYVCASCGFVHVKQRRTADEIAKSWEDIYRGKGYTSKWPAVEARLTYVAEWFGQQFGWEGKSVLEIGAGEGRFLELVRARGAYPVAMEPTASSCQTLRSKGIFAHHGTVEKCGKVGTFDVVAIAWTLENTQDCIGMLRVARSNLADGGHALIATGSRILTPFKKPIAAYFSKNFPDCHSFRFSATSLRNAALVAGLHQVAVNNYHESEWLVSAFISGTEAPVRGGDDPLKVLDFFHRWAEESEHYA